MKEIHKRRLKGRVKESHELQFSQLVDCYVEITDDQLSLIFFENGKRWLIRLPESTTNEIIEKITRIGDVLHNFHRFTFSIPGSFT